MLVIKKNGDIFLRSGFPVREIHGIGLLETCSPLSTSADRAWRNVYVSTQIEEPYVAHFRQSPHLFIGVVRSGSAQLVWGENGQEQYTQMRTGHLAIVSPGLPLTLKLERRIHTTHLYLRDSLLSEVAGDVSGSNFSSFSVATNLAVADPLLEGLVTAIGDAVDLRPELADSYVEHLSRALACCVLQRYSTNSSSLRRADVPTRGKKHLPDLHALIDAEMGRKLPLAEMAAGTGLTVQHFARAIKAEVGMTPCQYLLHCRVERARYLLVATSLSLQQIASRCGFSDHMHFSSVFSKMIGQTPAVFRKTSRHPSRSQV